MRTVPCILILLLLAVATVPAAAGDEPTETRMMLSVTSPKQYETIWSNAVPPQATVVGMANASTGIQSLVVRSSVGEVSCRDAAEFSCTVPVAEGNETITVTLTDTRGKTSEAVLPVYVNVDIPPPPFITVIGKVTDTDGHRIPGATVTFASVLPLSGTSKHVTAETDGDGGYLIQNAFGYAQTITVERDGYITLHREVVFENTTNRLELTLEPEPEEKAVPGFGAWIAAIAVSGGLLAARSRRRLRE
ncbi:carboxypeptidase regulatory-like domain-containing protein [Methanoculleus frigidifontis]|nr:carboxypeptidase regulatory-like domain-containing protein [Methanoculleus sp. FWC-SCC1]